MPENKLKVLELFAGIGACSKALTNLGIEHEIVDAVEIDKYAVQSFNAIHGTNFEPQDITKWDKDIECDLIMHESPCQDFSVAGKGAGGDKDSGTRSSLMYETLRIVEKLKPKYVVWENVKNLLSKKHRHNFDAYIDAMTELGYSSYYQVLNAKDYGVPQNRERVFTVSIRNGDNYTFPEPILLEKRLKDVLEQEVDEKYYLSDGQVSKIRVWENRQKDEGRGFRFNTHGADDIATTMATSADRPSTSNYYAEPRAIDPQGRLNKKCKPKDYAPTLRAQTHGNPPQVIEPKDNYVIVDDIYKNREPRVYPNTVPTIRANRRGLKVMGVAAIKTANKKGYDMAANGDSIDLAYPSSQTRRGRVGHGVAKTLATTDTMGTMQGLRIRKLTPKECWRLMGFDDKDFDRAKASGVSNSQLYKQAGNSIVVNVLEGVLGNLLGSKS